MTMQTMSSISPSLSPAPTIADLSRLPDLDKLRHIVLTAVAFKCDTGEPVSQPYATRCGIRNYLIVSQVILNPLVFNLILDSFVTEGIVEKSNIATNGCTVSADVFRITEAGRTELARQRRQKVED